MLVVGSRAIKAYYDDFREPKDYDLFLSKKDVEGIPDVKMGKECCVFTVGEDKVECQFEEDWISCLLFEEWNRDIPKIYPIRYIDVPHFGSVQIAHPHCMLALKRSHLHRDLNWYKHIQDLSFLKKKIRKSDWKVSYDNCHFYNIVLAERTKETKEKFRDKTPKLNKSKYDFFDDKVIKHMEHDKIHEIVSYYGTPLFEECQTSEVFCHKNLWDDLNHLDQIRMAREEILTIGIERILIPKFMEKKPHKFFYREAWMYAIRRVCTTLTGGWFRDFCIDNYDEIVDCDFHKIFDHFFKVANGSYLRIESDQK